MAAPPEPEEVRHLKKAASCRHGWIPMKPKLDAPYLETFGLLLTYRCNVSCSHCMVSAGPQRREEIALEDALDWVAQIAAYRAGRSTVLSLTGGEPFCCIDKMKKIIEFVQRALGQGRQTCGFSPPGTQGLESHPYQRRHLPPAGDPL